MLLKRIKKIVLCLSAIVLLIVGIGSNASTPVFAQTDADPQVETTFSPVLQSLINGGTISDLEELLPILYELEAVNLKFIRQPGWYHTITEEFTAYPGDHDGQPTEGMFPQSRIVENWGGVTDYDGTLGFGSYTVVSSLEGERLQVLADDAEDQGGNVTLLERGLQDAFGSRASEGEAVWQASLPTHLRSQLTDYINNMISFAANRINLTAWVEENQSGELVLRISKQHRYPQAYNYDELPEPLLGFNHEDTISLKTGDILERTSTAVYASGAEAPWGSTLLKLSEPGITMPPEVYASYQADIARAEELKKNINETTQAEPMAKLSIVF